VAEPPIREPITAPISGSDAAPPARDLLRYALALLAITAVLTWVIAWAATATSHGATGAAWDVARNEITVALADEPPQLDSTRATDQYSFMVLGHVMEGLISYDARNRLTPGVAERWTIRPDGATFHLRANARWSDGKPVTAHDFVYAWRTMLDPKTASEYAFIAFGIENAEAVNAGEKPVTALGVTAVDDRTLEVRFARPIAFFDKLMGFAVFYPIREDFHRAQQGRYGADAHTLLYNGPFRIDTWVHGAQLRMVRNPTYWNPERPKLDAVNIGYITSDTGTWVNLFRDGKIAHASLDSENIATALAQRWHIEREITGSVYFIEFNHRPGRLTDNVHLRRALQLVFDPDEFVNKVVKIPGNLPARSLFPSWIQAPGGPFVQAYPPPWHARVDVEAARRELEIARRELGLEKFPPLVLLNSDSSIANKQAEYLQRLWKETLGLDIRIDTQIFKQRLAKMTAGQFDLVAAGWGPDYDDPLTFGDLFASWNLNNRGRYRNDALDAQVRIAERSLDPAERFAAFAEIQRIQYEDAAIIPNYEQGKVYVQDPHVQGIVRRAVGPSPDYTNARIVPVLQ
jgi:oligopeptide transport system substrate-binding protein